MNFDFSNEEYSVPFSALVHETPRAYLLRFDDDREIWLPKSAASVDLDRDGSGCVTAPAWLLDNNDINYDL